MPETMRRVIALSLRCMPLAFYAGLVVTTLVCLMPSTSVPTAFQFWDKAQHAFGFAMLGVTGAFTFPNRLQGLCVGLIVYGVAIEVMQSTLTTTRTGDAMDCLADTLGVFIGLAVYSVLARTRSFAQASA
jgi:VanZ family protein